VAFVDNAAFISIHKRGKFLKDWLNIIQENKV